MPNLKPCPYCRKIDYEYGWSFANYAIESAMAFAHVKISGVTAVGKFVKSGGSGLGLFSLPKLFYQGVFLGLDGNPLLRCRHCNHPVICCHKCNNYMVLERHPETAELIECPFCRAQFQACENNNEFDALLK